MRQYFGMKPPLHRLVVPALLAISLTCMSCRRPLQSGAVIDVYRTAECVAPTYVTWVVSPQTRGWDTTITLASGAKAAIRGADMVSGNITIRFEGDGAEIVAVKPGDYIYPKDVRLNNRRDRLFVKASGLAAGIWDETWLYEFDLLERKQVRKNRVDADVLPPECPMPKRR